MSRHASATSEWVTTCAKGPDWLKRDEPDSEIHAPCLMIAWSAAEPGRLGEVALADEHSGGLVLGRGGATPSDPAERLCFCRQRPGSLQPTSPLNGDGMSRRQCMLRAAGVGFEVERVGRCPVLIDGRPIQTGLLRPGQTLTIRDQLVLYATRRSPWHRQRHFDPSKAGPFGGADRYGLVGESSAAWELRDQLAFAAASDKHVLILGESGSGKELAARAMHAMSPRSGRALVARNAATFPATLVDAELFGNASDYPNSGMPARPGVIGQAHLSTLFLDEIAELPAELQSHLLRVLDRGGEYQSLGDARARHSDFRLVAATNRDPTELRLDIAARFTLQVTVPVLDDRRDDIPLLVRHLLLEVAKRSPALRARFFDETPGGLEPRVDPDLIEALLRHQFSYHVRELEALLWKAVSASTREYVAFTRELREDFAVRSPLQSGHPAVDATPIETAVREPNAQEIVECLQRNGSHVPSAARELGLRSRYALYRLMRKHGIAVERAR